MTDKTDKRINENSFFFTFECQKYVCFYLKLFFKKDNRAIAELTEIKFSQQ